MTMHALVVLTITLAAIGGVMLVLRRPFRRFVDRQMAVA
jgi:hypothetical protein